MIPGDIPTPDIPGLVGELENQARALAEQRGLDPARVLGVVRRGIELIDRHGEGIPQTVLMLLRQATEQVSPERVLEVLEREDLLGIFSRLGLPAHLADENTPFHTVRELADLIGEFRAFLRRHEATLLEVGDPQADFARSRWLHRNLSRLYYLRVPASELRLGASSPKHTEFDIWQFREAVGERAHERDTGRLKLDRDDAVRLVKGRGKLLELKLGVLARLEESLRRGDHEELWSGCL